MACARPWLMQSPINPHKKPKFNSFWTYNPVATVPCGYCLNCRVDKANQWIDRCKYEYKKRLTASFVTITYDDIHLHDDMYFSPQTNELVASLNYKHVRRFINRLRMYIKRLPKEQQNVLCQPDFSYVYVGEYGENGQVFDRPHFHILFFGLDFAYCKKIFEKEWKFGIIDVLPLLDGGISYVLDYVTKQCVGDEMVVKYDDNLLARPKRCQSRKFATGLFEDDANVEDIKAHYGTYQVSPDVRRPVPMYYKKKIFGDWSPINREEPLLARMESDARTKNEMRTTYHLRDTSGKAMLAFRKRQAAIRERKLRQKYLNHGIGVYDYLTDSDVYFSPNREKMKYLDNETKHWLVSDYIKSLEVGVS